MCAETAAEGRCSRFTLHSRRSRAVPGHYEAFFSRHVDIECSSISGTEFITVDGQSFKAHLLRWPIFTYPAMVLFKLTR